MTTDEPGGGRRRRRRRLAAGLAAALAACLGLAWALLPAAGLRWGLITALRDLGMAEITIVETDLSLFRGHVLVRRMVARPPAGAALGVEDLALRFRWAPLLERRLVVDRVALRGVEIDIRRDPRGGGVEINGLPLAVAGANAAGDKTPWAVSIASLELTDSRLVVAEGGSVLDIAVERLVVENLHSRDPAAPMSIRLRGNLNGAPVELGGSLHPFAAAPSFSISATATGLDLARLQAVAARSGLAGLGGRLDLSLSLGGVLEASGPVARLSGRLGIEQPALTAPARLAAGRLSLEIGHADWNGRRLDLAGALAAEGLAAASPTGSVTAAHVEARADSLTWGDSLAWRGGLVVTGGGFAAPGIEAHPDSLAWNGRLDLETGGERLRGGAEGRLDLGGLRLAADGISWSHRRAQAEGRLEFGGGGVSPVTARLSLMAEGLALRQPARRLDWLAAERIEGREVVLGEDGAVTAGSVAATGLAVLRQQGRKGHPWRLEVRSLLLDQPARGAGGELSAGEARADGAVVRLNRTREGLALLPSSSGQAGPPAETDAGPAPGFALGRLVLSGDSRILFEDRSLGEVVRLEARAVRAVIRDLDSRTPGGDTAFEIQAALGGGQVALSGTARPFADPPSGRLEARIQAVDLPPLSPYAADILGLHLHTGQVDAGFKGGAERGALDGRLDLVVSRLQVAAPVAGTAARRQDLPIETALDLLRDGDGRIRLTLPVRGRLDNPDVDTSDAVAQVVGGALKSTVQNVLKLAFPLFTIVSMVIDGEEKARLALPPLDFPPGRDELTEASRQTLAGTARLMAERPAVKLTLCGRADEADWPVLAERRRAEGRGRDDAPPNRDVLVRLAEARAAAARSYLIEHAAVAAGRLFTCRVQIGPGPDGASGARVDLLL